MPDPHAALITQLKNIQARTGQRIEALAAAAAASGAVKHADRRSWLMQQHGLGYGDANTVAHFVDKPVPDLGSSGPPAWAAGAVGATAAPAADVLDTLYTGPKAQLRPLHAAVLAAVRDFGSFEEAPKKSYVSLRRSKQFAMVGPATKDSVEIGLNARDLPPHPRLKPLPPGGMCQATTRISTLAEVDADLIGWLRQAYAAAG
jgi:hypothetical protein